MQTINVRLLIIIVALLVYGLGWLVWYVWRGRPKKAAVSPDLAALLDVLHAAPVGILLLEGEHVTYQNGAATTLLEKAAVQLPHLLERLPAQADGKAAAYKSFKTQTGMAVGVWMGDVDQQRILLVEEQKADQQAHELQQFWGSVSHELRTPITSILAHVEVARSAETPPDILHSSLDIAHQQTLRVSRMIQGVLALSRLSTSSLEMRPVDIIVLAEEAVAELILLAEEQQIAIELMHSAAVAPVLGNADKLKQVFVNLLDNAIKYCAADDTISLTLTAQEKGVLCMVRDTGPGIAAAHLPHLTDQFFRVRRDVSGSGLGLAIVHEIVRQHHGLLKIDSVSEGDESGTTFSFVLPYGGDNLL